MAKSDKDKAGDSATGTPPANNQTPPDQQQTPTTTTTQATPQASSSAKPKADPGEGYRFEAILDPTEEPIYTNNPRYAKSLQDRGAQVTEINKPKLRR